MANEIISTTADLEIVSTRTFNFSRALVYKAWTDPNHLKNWWGPAGFTNTFLEFDLSIGGRWKFIMHGPDKGNYPNECEFIEIEKPSLIAWKRLSKPYFKVVVTFEELIINETKVVFKMIFATPKECNKLKPFVVDKNEENFVKLEVELTEMANSEL
ncbi:SRPBCC family protein [Pedobacter mucosus]|uniref:SRPBCC family protein n=1 Tax=Pedobacter mucosus TaxID=2895286 RepID=UPI001EE4888B|nr:SRPBCC family protein [Pedobacter mucosus]UKT64027.1 SRPBCC family protein [Pedobacter mucosus]